jgi:Ca-activated chloride channel homolog
MIELDGKISAARWKTALSLRGGQQRQDVSGLWARRKIAALMDQYRRGSEQRSIEKAIIDTAIEHHLVSKFTSLLAVDISPARKREDVLNKHAVPVNLPAGWNHEKVFATMPATATAATLNFIVGLACLLLCILSRKVLSHV